MRGIKIIGRIFSTLITLGLAVLLISNIYVIIAKTFLGIEQPEIFGYSSAVVISGSMAGSIEIDDMVLIHKQDDYQVGDVITFESGSSLVTHRIVDEENGEFITKGDANNTEDMEPVLFENIIGKVVFVIPKIGVFIQYLQTPLGMAGMLIIGVLLIEIPYFFEKEDEEKEITGGSNSGKGKKK